MVSVTGYSGKLLADKLGLKAGMTAAAIAPPATYASLLGSVPVPGPLGRGSYEFIHLFVPGQTALDRLLPRALARLAPHGALWVSWPKKTSPLFKDLTEDGIRASALALGIVDVKVCAVDADWSALKLMRRTGKTR